MIRFRAGFRSHPETGHSFPRFLPNAGLNPTSVPFSASAHSSRFGSSSPARHRNDTVGPAPWDPLPGSGAKDTKLALRLRLSRCAPARLRLFLLTGYNGPRAAPWTGSGEEVSRGAPGLAERRQFLPLPPPSAIAEAFQSRHVRQRRLRTGPEGQGTSGLATLRVARQPAGPSLSRDPPCC